MSTPVPKYTFWEGLNVALHLGMRALEEIRTLARTPGPRGADGLGFEDMTEELDVDGRTIIRRYSRGDLVKEFRHTFNVVLDRGIWKDGTYQNGDGVSWGGRYFIAQRTTSAKPQMAEPNGDWRLAVNKGRDGKDGVVRTINEKPIVKVT